MSIMGYICADGTLLVTAENPDQLLVVDPAASAIVKEYDTGGETPHIVPERPILHAVQVKAGAAPDPALLLEL
jgi:hypothetical protein